LVRKSYPEARLEVFSSSSDLALRLVHPKDKASVVVIVLSGDEETKVLLPVRHIISDTAIIVVLPDDSPDMTALAHRLRPQYISFLDSDFSELISVIGRMIKIRERFGRIS